MVSRLSTRTFALRAAAHLDAGAKLRDVFDLPMLVNPLETMDRHDAAIFFILGPVQVGKSATGQLHLGRNHLVRPRPAGWYGPTLDFIKDFADQKLNPLLEAIPELRALRYPDDRTKSSKLTLILANGSHRLLSAQTENDRTGKTFCDLYLDEPHLYQPGWLEQIFNRSADYADESKKVLMSTGLTIAPDAPGSEAAKLWATTDRRLWHVRCPVCRRYHEPRYLHRARPDDPASPIIGGLRYERATLDNGLPHEARIAATLRYECPHCHATLPDAHGSRLALSGTANRPQGIYVLQNASPSARRFGWQFSAIAVRAWLPIVMRWELAQLARARGDLEPLGKCIREEFGGLWNPVLENIEKKLDLKGGYKLLPPVETVTTSPS